MRINSSFGTRNLKTQVEKADYGYFVIWLESDEEFPSVRTYITLRAEEMEALQFQINSALLHEEMTDGVSNVAS